MKKSRKLTEVEKIISQKIEELRLSRGLSRMALSELIGVSHQQTQKYCKGTDRISAGRLQLIAKALRVNVSCFFEEYIPVLCAHERLTLEMSRAFNMIKNEEGKEALLKLAKTMH